MDRSSVLHLLAQLKSQIKRLSEDLEVLEKEKNKLTQRRSCTQRLHDFYSRALETEKNAQSYIKTVRIL